MRPKHGVALHDPDEMLPEHAAWRLADRLTVKVTLCSAMVWIKATPLLCGGCGVNTRRKERLDNCGTETPEGEQA